MKHLIFSCLITALLLAACTGHRENHRLMEQAERLMRDYPDSALHLLQQVEVQKIGTEEETARYVLLWTEAKYKNQLPLANDSLMQHAIAYYERKGDLRMLGKAYFCLGLIHMNRKTYHLAVKANHCGMQLAEQTNDSAMLCRIRNNLAYIYQYQQPNAQADSIYAINIALAQQIGDTVRWAEALIRRGIYSLSLGEEHYGQAEQFMNQAYPLLQNSPQLMQFWFSSMSILCSYMGDTRKAFAVAKLYTLTAQTPTNLARANLLVGNAYYNAEQYDSATVYLHKALQTDDSTIKSNCYALLSAIAKQQNNPGQALAWETEKGKVLQMELNQRQKAEVTAAEMDFRLTQTMTSHTNLTPYYVIGALAMFAIGIGLLLRKKEKQDPATSPQTSAPRWDYASFLSQMKTTDTYALLQDILSYYRQYADYQQRFTDSIRERFMQHVERLLPGHADALRENYPNLNRKELLLCYLYLLGFSDQQIGILCERDRSTIHRNKEKMLAEKMHHPKGDLISLIKMR